MHGSIHIPSIQVTFSDSSSVSSHDDKNPSNFNRQTNRRGRDGNAGPAVLHQHQELQAGQVSTRGSGHSKGSSIQSGKAHHCTTQQVGLEEYVLLLPLA